LIYASKPKKLTKENLIMMTNISGVYILLTTTIYQYQYKQSNIIYIGMSGNIKQRLKSYANKHAHTLKMQKVLYTKIIYYQYIKIDYPDQLEEELLKLFKKEYGQLPYLNCYTS
jgi:excinuclease UvrABC nuclease subunit